MLRQLLAHSSVYTAGSALVTLAGLISFPIFTRLFKVEEYGLMGLISASLLLLVGIAKLGVQHSIVRFYGEILVGKREATPAAFYSTVLAGQAGTGIAASILCAALSLLVPAGWWSDSRVKGLLLLTAILVFIRATDSAMVNILRAQERSAAFNVYAVIKRYASLAAVLIVIFYLLPGLNGFYSGTILVEAVAACSLFLYLRGACRFSLSAFSPPLYRAMLAFGIPMIGYELGGIILAVGDRFVIQNLLGGEALGLYAAAYNLCEYVQTILLASVGQAIVPMYVRLWEQKGEGEMRRFVEAALHYYVMLGAAIVAGLAAVAPELLAVLASEKYLRGAAIIPYVAGGMVLGGAMSIFGAGINIHKQTRILMVLVVGCAALNLGLNVLLIPHLGIEGAAVATLVSYACLAGLTYAVSNRLLPIALPWAAIVKFMLLALLMYWVVKQVAFATAWLTLAARVLIGATSYAVLVLLFDRLTRGAAKEFLQRVLPRSNAG